MKNRFFSIACLPLLLNACVYEKINTSTTATVTNTTTNIKEKKTSLEILIEQKKNNGEIISIGSKAVKSVLVDDIDYPVSKLLKNEFRIEIQDLTQGKHKLSVNLYFLNASFSVPIIIPVNTTDKVLILLRANIDEKTGETKKIEYGYDFDRNGSIDNNIEHFESDNKSFFIINKDGRKQSIDLDLTSFATITSEKVPTGVLSTTNQTKIEITQPQITTPEIPKPQAGVDSLYPLPPNINKNNDPLLPSSKPEPIQIPTSSSTPPAIDIEELN